MIKLLIYFVILPIAIFLLGNQPAMAVANTNSPDQTLPVLVCFSGGEEIFRKNVVEGPFADEYKFAHEIKVSDSEGQHWVNFSGGMCVIDQGEVFNKKQPKLTDNLSCYSGAKKVVTFDVYGEETTIDEYVEGRTFLAKASGSVIASNSIHQYLLFGSGTCIGEEIGED